MQSFSKNILSPLMHSLSKDQSVISVSHANEELWLSPAVIYLCISFLPRFPV